uniref:Ig-like domain-containing protein n=2 Tax=Gouania willdenowi TaxID=441366 RepID=A0A8C5NBR6_GOUWI
MPLISSLIQITASIWQRRYLVLDDGLHSALFIPNVLTIPEHYTIIYKNGTFSPSDWDDVVVIKEGTPATLICIDTPVSGSVTIDWKVKKHLTDEWRLVLSANEETKFLEDMPKHYMTLEDPNFKNTGNFSLLFRPRVEDSGLYSCLIDYQKKNQKETLILLAVLSVIIGPASPVPLNSTLRLIAQISPNFTTVRITWISPEGIVMRSKNLPGTGTFTKLPLVQKSDSGAYVCVVQAWAKSRGTLFAFNVDVNVDGTLSNEVHLLLCPIVPGDYVKLYWVPHDTSKQDNMRLVYQYDRWRNSTLLTNESKRFQVAGPLYNAMNESFSILLLRLRLKDGGLYVCKVFLNDNVFSRSTVLSIMRVKVLEYPSKLELSCAFTERSHARSVVWRHHNENYKLQMFNNGPGSVKTIVPLPITPNTTGNYSCILQLNDGQVFQAIQEVTQPLEETSADVTNPSMFASLSALLLLVPLVATAVGVLLWRQKHISDRGIEQSLSVHLSDTENIYENPDVREVMNTVIVNASL